MSHKKQAALSAVLTVAALLLAPVFAGGLVMAEVVEINVPEFLPAAAPFLYFIGFTVAAAALGAKGKKSSGVMMLAILAVCIIASGMITTAVFGTTEPLPTSITLPALPFLFLYSPAASLIYGFMEAVDYNDSLRMLPYVVVYCIPVIASLAFAIGLCVNKKKAGAGKAGDLNEE